MKRNRKRNSAWFPWESLALLHCSFCQDNGCKRPSAGARTKDAEHRPLSHTNALCAVFIAWTGKHPTEQIFPSFCRCFGNTEKARATLLYSLFGESASKYSPFSAVVSEIRRRRGLRFCTLSLERVRASHSTGRGTPAPCLLLLGGQKPCTHFLPSLKRR